MYRFKQASRAAAARKTSTASFAKIAKTLSIIVVTTITVLTLSPAFAASKTVTLSVPSMYCEMCPITVKKALNKVEGVSKVEASFEKKEAVVTFDDAKTTVKALTKATEDAGYPSHVVGGQ